MRRLRFLEKSLADVSSAYSSALQATKAAAEAARNTADEKEALIDAYRRLASDVIETTNGTSETSKRVVDSLTKQVTVLEGKLAEQRNQLREKEEAEQSLVEDKQRLESLAKQQQERLRAVSQIKLW